MLLREMYESRGVTVGIIFGRFNPPHQGHKAAWQMASKCDNWFVGTNRSTVGPKDPLPFDVKVEAMKTVCPDLEGHVVAEQSWLTLASKVYKEFGDVTLYTFTDEDWVTKTLIQYNGKEGPHGFYQFSVIEQKQTPRLSSATSLRDAVAKGDREGFSQAAGVPADTLVGGVAFFDLVAEYLLPYLNAPVKTKKPKMQEDATNFGNNPVLADIKAHLSRPLDAFANGKVDLKGLQVFMMKLARLLSIKYRMELDKVKSMMDEYAEFMLSPVSEECAGVGIITKQNSTKDVNKGTLKKMMKGFKL